jgi:ribosomal-protein-alanine N-acetyltransferase
MGRDIRRQNEVIMNNSIWGPVNLHLNDHAQLLVAEKAAFPNSWDATRLIQVMFTPVPRKKVFAYCTDASSIVGYIGLDTDDCGDAYINNLGVIPQFRNQGLGEKLVKHAVNIAAVHKRKRVWLHVAADNMSAINLYFKLGFRITGFLKDYAGRDQDVLTMTKE